MRPGTPLFVGARLREAREARALTGIALADLLGISRAAISQYEGGTKTPSPEIMEGLVLHLNLPPAFFLRPESKSDGGMFFYRSMAAATKQARMRAERRGSWLMEIATYVKRFFAFPVLDLGPSSSVSSEAAELDRDDIESVAADLRQAWGLGEGPIGNVAWLLENHGVMVSRCALGADTLDALSWRSGDRAAFVMLGSEKASAVRSRFDAAHELAHMILHRHIGPRTLGSTVEFKRIETQAHRFAAALLLPARSFLDDFYSASLDALLRIKEKWRVSVKLIIKRLAELRVLPEGAVQKLYINYSRRGWTRSEPLDDTLELERPALLRRSIEMLTTKGMQTPDDIRHALPYSEFDIEDLCGLPRGYFKGFRSEVRVAEPAVRPLRSASKGSARVIPLARGGAGKGGLSTPS